MDERHAKGLYFNYDDKFYRSHVCKSKLFVIVMTNEKIEDLTEQDNLDVIQINTQDNLEINLNSLTGQHTPRTLRLTRYIQNRHIKILIDGGSTHNFIQPKIVKHPNLPVKSSNVFKVMVDNEKHLECSGVVNNLVVAI